MKQKKGWGAAHGAIKLPCATASMCLGRTCMVLAGSRAVYDISLKNPQQIRTAVAKAYYRRQKRGMS